MMRPLRVLSWNVEGLEKFLCDRGMVVFLVAFSIICLQETFCTSLPSLGGFSAYSELAVPTGGRPSRGSTIFLKNEVFGQASISPVRLSHPFLHVIRVTWPGSHYGLIIANSYIPAGDATSSISVFQEIDSWLQHLRLV